MGGSGTLLDMSDCQALFASCLRESQLGEMDSAALMAKRIIHSAPHEASAALRLDARVRLIWIEFQNGENSAARATAQLAITEACAIGDSVRESLARSLYARVLAEGSEGDTAADEVVAALRLARSTDDALTRSVACANLARLCARGGLYDAAVDLAQQAVDQAERSQNTEAIALAISNFGSLHADYLYRYRPASPAQRQDYLTIAIDASRRATEFAHRHGDGEMQRRSGYNLSEFLLIKGDLPGGGGSHAGDGCSGRDALASRADPWWAMPRLCYCSDKATRQHSRRLRKTSRGALAYPFRQLAMFASEHRSRLLAELGRHLDAYQGAPTLPRAI